MASVPVRQLKRSADLLVVAAFALCVWLPLLVTLFHSGESATFENRRLAVAPPVPRSLRDCVTFPEKFEGYFNDNFAFRSELIRWNNRVRVRWLGWSPPLAPASPTEAEHPADRIALADTARQVVLRTLHGKDGWLFFGSDEALRSESRVPFTAAELSAWTSALRTREAWLRARNIRHLVVVCPNKGSIYPEFLPEPYASASGPTRLDELISALQGSDVTVLDLRPALLAAKQTTPTYSRTDTHWNDFGAFVACGEILSALSLQFGDLNRWQLTDFEVRRRERAGGDLTIILGLSAEWPEQFVELIPQPARRAQPPVVGGAVELDAVALRKGAHFSTRHPDRSLPSAIVFHDSFGYALRPFLSESFSAVLYYVNHLEFVPGVIRREQPDIVIEAFSERRLAGPLPSD